MAAKKKKQLGIALGLGLAAAAVIGLAYYLTRKQPASGNGSIVTGTGSPGPTLTVNGDTGLANVMPGITVPIAVTNGKPGDAVVINSAVISGTNMGSTTTIAAGTFDQNGNFNASTIFGLNPNGPVPNPRLLLTSSLPANMMTTYNIVAQDTSAGASSNTVQVTVSLASSNGPKTNGPSSRNGPTSV
jgi:hypothetical protein